MTNKKKKKRKLISFITLPVFAVLILSELGLIFDRLSILSENGSLSPKGKSVLIEYLCVSTMDLLLEAYSAVKKVCWTTEIFADWLCIFFVIVVTIVIVDITIVDIVDVVVFDLRNIKKNFGIEREKGVFNSFFLFCVFFVF